MQCTWMPRSFLAIFSLASFFTTLSPTVSQADADASVREKLRTIPLPASSEQCSAASAREQVSAADVRAAIFLSQVAANADAEQATATTDGLLNGRGYNYGPDPGHFNFAVLQHEIELKRQSESK